MAKRKSKPEMAWKVLQWSAVIEQVDVSKMKKLKRNGYVDYFETFWDAAEYKMRKLRMTKLMYSRLKEPMPESYEKQIKQMEAVYGKEGKELPFKI